MGRVRELLIKSWIKLVDHVPAIFLVMGLFESLCQHFDRATYSIALAAYFEALRVRRGLQKGGLDI